MTCSSNSARPPHRDCLWVMSCGRRRQSVRCFGHVTLHCKARVHERSCLVHATSRSLAKLRITSSVKYRHKELHQYRQVARSINMLCRTVCGQGQRGNGTNLEWGDCACKVAVMDSVVTHNILVPTNLVPRSVRVCSVQGVLVVSSSLRRSRQFGAGITRHVMS